MADHLEIWYVVSYRARHSKSKVWNRRTIVYIFYEFLNTTLESHRLCAQNMYMRFGVGMGLFYDLLKTEAEKLYALFHNRHIFLVMFGSEFQRTENATVSL